MFVRGSVVKFLSSSIVGTNVNFLISKLLLLQRRFRALPEIVSPEKEKILASGSRLSE